MIVWHRPIVYIVYQEQVWGVTLVSLLVPLSNISKLGLLSRIYYTLTKDFILTLFFMIVTWNGYFDYFCVCYFCVVETVLIGASLIGIVVHLNLQFMCVFYRDKQICR